MREDLQDYDSVNAKDPDIPDDIEEDSSLTHIYLGAAQKPLTLNELHIAHGKDDAMANITAKKLADFFKYNLPADHHPPHSKKITILNEQVGLTLFVLIREHAY